TSFDVLYSLPERDERAALEEMHRLTRPGGFVLINVAAMEVLRGNHSILSRELRRYTPARLRRLVTDAGFEVVWLAVTNRSLFVPMVIVRTLHRWRGLAVEDGADKAQHEISVPPAPINGLLSAMLFVESLWLRRMNNWVGSSLLCLARKPA